MNSINGDLIRSRVRVQLKKIVKKRLTHFLFFYLLSLQVTVTREWDKPDMTCTKYIKTLSGETDNSTAASSRSHSDR